VVRAGEARLVQFVNEHFAALPTGLVRVQGAVSDGTFEIVANVVAAGQNALAVIGGAVPAVIIQIFELRDNLESALKRPNVFAFMRRAVWIEK
jgi:hypothetical protein